MEKKHIELREKFNNSRRRSLAGEVVVGDEELLRLSVSSDDPYLTLVWSKEENYPEWAYEVLSHKSDAVDLKRFKDGGAILVNHDQKDPYSHIGKIENAELTNTKLYVDVRFSKNNPVAQMVKQDIEDGIRTHTSIGYKVNEYEVIRDESAEYPTYVATRWEAVEASIVPVPADPTVGVGRSLTRTLERDFDITDEEVIRSVESLVESNEVVTDESELQDETLEDASLEKNDSEIITNAVESESGQDSLQNFEELIMDEKTNVQSDESALEATAGADLDAARRDAKEIVDFCVREGFAEYAGQFVAEGLTLEAAKARMFDLKPTTHREVETKELSNSEMSELNVAKGIANFARGESSEIDEFGREIAKRNGVPLHRDSLYLPLTLPIIQRGFVSSVAAGAGALVATEYISLEQALREESLIGKLGMQLIEGARNKITMPRQLTPSVAQWTGEASAVSAQDSGSYTTATWSPNQLAIRIPMSKVLAEALDGEYTPVQTVLSDIFLSLQDAIETGIFQGSGTNQPYGLLNDTNISALTSPTGSTNDLYTKAWKTVADNKGRAGQYVVSNDVYQAGLDNSRYAGGFTPIIADGIAPTGFRVTPTVRLPALSAVYGDFSKVLGVHFGVVRLYEDIYSDADNGNNILRGFAYFDSKARQPYQFAKASGSIDIT